MTGPEEHPPRLATPEDAADNGVVALHVGQPLSDVDPRVTTDGRWEGHGPGR